MNPQAKPWDPKGHPMSQASQANTTMPDSAPMGEDTANKVKGISGVDGAGDKDEEWGVGETDLENADEATRNLVSIAIRNPNQGAHQITEPVHSAKCTRCLKSGHFVLSCPKPPKCVLCEKDGHEYRDCPDKEPPVARPCKNCHTRDHATGDCPAPKTPHKPTRMMFEDESDDDGIDEPKKQGARKDNKGTDQKAPEREPVAEPLFASPGTESSPLDKGRNMSSFGTVFKRRTVSAAGKKIVINVDPFKFLPSKHGLDATWPQTPRQRKHKKAHASAGGAGADTLAGPTFSSPSSPAPGLTFSSSPIQETGRASTSSPLQTQVIEEEPTDADVDAEAGAADGNDDTGAEAGATDDDPFI